LNQRPFAPSRSRIRVGKLNGAGLQRLLELGHRPAPRTLSPATTHVVRPGPGSSPFPGAGSGPHSVLKAPQIRVNSRTRLIAHPRGTTAAFREFPAQTLRQGLLAMQKVEGSNPFSRSRKGLPFAGLFRVCSRLVSLRGAGPKPDPRQSGRAVRLEEDGCLQVSLGRSNRRSLWKGDAEGHEFVPSGEPVSVRNRVLARVGPTDLEKTVLVPS
jgi:hypothetical protein